MRLEEALIGLLEVEKVRVYDDSDNREKALDYYRKWQVLHDMLTVAKVLQIPVVWNDRNYECGFEGNSTLYLLVTSLIFPPWYKKEIAGELYDMLIKYTDDKLELTDRDSQLLQAVCEENPRNSIIKILKMEEN